MSCPGNGGSTCNGNGRCDLTTGSCICIPGFEGTQCEGQSDRKYFLLWFFIELGVYPASKINFRYVMPW